MFGDTYGSAVTDSPPLVAGMARRAQNYLPERLETLLSPAYCLFNSIQADRAHASPTHVNRTVEDAPDHVVLVVVDALRRDFTPDVNADFFDSIAPSTWTFPTMSSVHTGLYPHQHGAMANSLSSEGDYAIPAQVTDRTLLPHEMEAAGYDTYAGLSFIVPFLATNGWYQKHKLYGDASCEEVFTDHLSWLEGRDRTFSYLHTADLHGPIDPPEAYTADYEIDRSFDLDFWGPYADSYDDTNEDGIRFRTSRLNLYRAALDHVSDRLDEYLARLPDDTAVVITGDHGEGHWEQHDRDRRFADPRGANCTGHGGTPFDVVARTRTAVKLPDGDLTPRGGWPSLVDVPATIADLTFEEQPFGPPAVSWLSPIDESRSVICEGVRYGHERKAVYKNGYKLIHSVGDDTTLAATVDADGERFEDPPSDAVVEELLGELPDDWGGDDRAETGRMVSNRLEALGYK